MHSRFVTRTTSLISHPRATARRKIAFQALLVTGLILLSPLAAAQTGITRAFGSETPADSLDIIDSPTLDLSQLPVSEDGFLMKSGGQTTSADRGELSDIIEYQVESGDTLGSIAQRFGVSVDTLLSENDGITAKNLKVDSTIRILPVSGITYTVTAGDTLDSIAAAYQVDTDALARQNNIPSGATLTEGQHLIIPGAKKPGAAPAPTPAATKAPARTVTKQPHQRTIPTPSDSDGGDQSGKWMIKPTDGIYTRYFSQAHYAVDIADRSEPPVHAAAAGTVSRSQCGWNGGYGCMIVVDHGNGMQTLYAHLSKLEANVGDSVSQGEEIGIMGNTGRVYGTTGIHLHFEVIQNGQKRNPLAYY